MDLTVRSTNAMFKQSKIHRAGGRGSGLFGSVLAHKSTDLKARSLTPARLRTVHICDLILGICHSSSFHGMFSVQLYFF